MIDNICLLINGTLNRRQLSELVPKVCEIKLRFWSHQKSRLSEIQSQVHFSATHLENSNKWRQ